MNRIVILILILSPFTAIAGPEAEIKFNEITAEKYAQGALLEFWGQSPQHAEIDVLDRKPTILSGYGNGGEKIVLVLYASKNFTHHVGLYLNKDGYLEVFSRGTWLKPLKEIANEFKSKPFMPGK